MTAFLTWYFLVTLLGWLTFPLVFALFPALADRGYALSRAAGMLIWGYVFWLFASLGIAQNDSGGIILALIVIVALSGWSIVNRKSEIQNFLQSNKSLLLTTEILFLVAFAFLAFVRSANPELNGTERPMELAFINAILRSPTFPPQDPWLSGYAISYYYFGYVMTAMLARLSGIPGSMAHNLMTSLVFALGAIGTYGILYNLLAQSKIENRKSKIVNSLFAPLFLLLVSNFAALLKVLHTRGIFWTQNPATGEYTSRFWEWLDMVELAEPPQVPFEWLPLDRYLWWWRASRVIQDYDMRGNHMEVIDEFPFFSFLLGDLHPHVLAIPFGLLAIAAALHLFLGGWRGEIKLLLGMKLHITHPGFLFSALLLGGLAFLNTWDILIGAALIVGAYVFWRAGEDGWKWERLEEVFLLGLPLGFLAVLLYFPFYLGFSSQAGGILPNLMNPTRGAHFWVMWGVLLIPVFTYLLHLAAASPGVESSDSEGKPNWKLGLILGIGFTFLLWVFSWLIGWVGSYVDPDFARMFLESQGMTASQFFSAASLRRLNHITSLITLLAVLIPTFAFLFPKPLIGDSQSTKQSENRESRNTAGRFVLLLLLLGGILTLAPEFVYLRDQFGYRINTIFKFYYQAWMLWSIAAAFAVSSLFQNLREWRNPAFRVATGIVLFISLLYPVLGLMTKTENFNPAFGFTLDDFDRIQRENPAEANAIQFLDTVPNGVIAEAIGGSYSGYARISTYTGLQTVLGWPGHEAQWRGGYTEQGSRSKDIVKLYSTNRWDEAQSIIDRYNIRYIYIGALERGSMPVKEEKFRIHLKAIFEEGGVSIYEVP